jgi:hypothetical protein
MSTRAVIKRQVERYLGRHILNITRRAIPNIKLLRADGTTAATNITLVDADARNIGVNATILGVQMVTANTGVLVDHTEEATMASAGNMQLSTTNTTGHDLLVLVIDWDDNQ